MAVDLVDAADPARTPGLITAIVRDLTGALTGARTPTVDLLPDAVVVVDPVTARVVRVNEAACRLLGYPRAHLLRLTAEQLLPADADADLAAAGVDGRVTDVVLRTRTGAAVACEAFSVLRELDGGRPVVVHVFRDLGDVEQVARERRERFEQEFVTNAAHELRSPLTALLAAVDALADGAGEDAVQRHRFIAHLRRESARMARLADSLLLLARAQSVGPPPNEAVEVRALLESAAAALHVADGVRLRVECAPRLTVQTHRGLAEVLVGNLAANAARWTVAGQIRLTGVRTPDAVVLAVVDTGPGMDPQTLSRARDRFYRNTSERDGEGFGLGLSIAAQAADVLGATLDLASAPGCGTCASVTFPRERPPAG